MVNEGTAEVLYAGPFFTLYRDVRSDFPCTAFAADFLQNQAQRDSESTLALKGGTREEFCDKMQDIKKYQPN